MRSPFLCLVVLGWCVSVSLAEDSLKSIDKLPESTQAFIKYIESSRTSVYPREIESRRSFYLRECESRIQQMKKTRDAQQNTRDEKMNWKVESDGGQGTFHSEAAKTETLKLLDVQIKSLDQQVFGAVREQAAKTGLRYKADAPAY